MEITNEVKLGVKKWVESLRSGEFKQATGCLQGGHNSFCCLGVLVKTQVTKPHLHGGALAGGTITPFGQPNSALWMQDVDDDFKHRTGVRLSELNDNGKTFLEIADRLEEVYLSEVES